MSDKAGSSVQSAAQRWAAHLVHNAIRTGAAYEDLSRVSGRVHLFPVAYRAL